MNQYTRMTVFNTVTRQSMNHMETQVSEVNSTSVRSQRLVWGLLLLVVLAGAALRLYQLGAQSLWYDEGATLYLRTLVDCRGTILNPSANNEPPLNAILAKFWYGAVRTFTDYPVTSAANDFLIRLMPCFFGILTLPLFFLVGRRILQDDWAALIGVAFLALSPFQIYYAQELRIYTFYLVVCLLTVWAMLNALERHQWRYWIGMGAGMTLLMYSHYLSMWTIFCLNLFYLISLWAYRRAFWRWTLSNALMMVLIAPALYLAWQFNKIVLTIKYAWYPSPTWKTGLITFKDFFAGYGPSTWAYWPLFGLAAVLFLMGLWSLRRRWPMAVLLAVVTIVPIAGNVVLWSHRHFSFYEHRLFIFSALTATWAIGQGLRSLRRPGLIAAGGLLFVALTLPGLRDYYAHRLHPIEMHRLAVYDKVDFRSAAAYIQSRFQPGDLVGHASHFMVYPMKHYLEAKQCRLGRSDLDTQVFIDDFGNVPLLISHGLIPVPVETATRDVQRIWFTESFGTTFEYKPLTVPIREWLDAQWTAVERQTFDGLYVTLYVRKAAGAPTSTSEMPAHSS